MCPRVPNLEQLPSPSHAFSRPLSILLVPNLAQLRADVRKGYTESGPYDASSAPPRPHTPQSPSSIYSTHEDLDAASACGWHALEKALLATARHDTPVGAAAAHDKSEREAAAGKLLTNHVRVLHDLTNATKLNIDGKPLTQVCFTLPTLTLPHAPTRSHTPKLPRKHTTLSLTTRTRTRAIRGIPPCAQETLHRVAPDQKRHVDGFLRELARRMLGASASEGPLPEQLDASKPAQAAAWVASAAYLGARIQSSAEQCPGRKPDMSPLAAAAMKAVMAELSGEAAPFAEGVPPMQLPAPIKS